MKKYAVIVGIDHYPPESGISSLRYACRDAMNIKKALWEECGFEEPVLCLSDTEHKTDNQKIVRAISRYQMEIQPEDLFLFYFSGHGIHDGHDGHLLTPNSFQEQAQLYDTLALGVILKAISGLHSNHVVMLIDACRKSPLAGHRGEDYRLEEPFARDMELAVEAQNAHNRSLHLIFGCQVGERTWEDPTIGSGIFTYTLLEGLRGPAENQQNTVTAVSLYDYCSRRTPDLCTRLNASVFRPLKFSVGNDFSLRECDGFDIICPDEIHYPQDGLTPIDIYCSGGRAPFQWAFDGLPNRMTADKHSENSRIVQLCGAAERCGKHCVRVSVTDQQQKTVRRNIILTVRSAADIPPVKIKTEELPAGFTGQSYQAVIRCEGGKAPYHWALTELPEGLHVTDSTDQECGIAGTPEREGHWTIGISVADSTGRRDQTEWPITLTVLNRHAYCDVPDGTFKIGYHETPERNLALSDNGVSPEEIKQNFPPAELTAPAFAIRKYPVTNQEYFEFLTAEGFQSTPQGWSGGRYPDGRGRHPVTGISFEDAERYCRWKGTRLPTSQEWEKAARGTDGRLYPWGDQYQAGCANCREDGEKGVQPVEHGNAESPYGVRQLVGNTWEYVDGGRTVLTEDHNYAIQRSVRGSSFRNKGAYWGMAFRSADDYIQPTALYDSVGRKVYDLPKRQNLGDVGFRDCADLGSRIPAPQRFILFASRRINGIMVSAFSIAQFAVSNQEYYEFVAETGHTRPAHWNTDGLPYPWEHRYRPVVNVTLHDAEAFCRWKSDKLIRLGILSEDTLLDIPTELQYKAAFGDTHYPWGNRYEACRCNSRESGWARTVRIDELPDGATCEGVFNLLGNVHEWVAGGQKITGGSWRCEYGCQKFVRNTPFIDVYCENRGCMTQNSIGFRYCGPAVINDLYASPYIQTDSGNR